jgi:hypothetical protein
MQHSKVKILYRVSAKKRPDFIAFSGSKECRYGLIIDKYQSHNTKKKLKSVALVCERTILIEQPPLVCEVSANFCGERVSRGQRNGSPRSCSRLSRPESHNTPSLIKKSVQLYVSAIGAPQRLPHEVA